MGDQQITAAETLNNSQNNLRKFISLFLEGEQLQKVMKYLCETSLGQVTDPITDVVCVMITSPLAFVITEVGVAPFKDKFTHVYPYSHMNREQRAFIRSVVESHRDSAGSVSNTKNATASLQMGGGCIIEIPNSDHANNKGQQRNQPLYLKAENVLECLCRSVIGNSTTSGGEKWKRHGVCSIILQRVSSSIHIPRETLQRIGETIERIELEQQMHDEQEDEDDA